MNDKLLYHLQQISMFCIAMLISGLPEPFRTIYTVGFLIDLIDGMYVCFHYVLKQQPPPILSVIVHAETWPLWLVKRALRGSWLIIRRRRA